MSHKITEEDSMMEKKIKEKYTGPRVTDTATFIQKARWVHGDEYDYSKVEYTDKKTKVEIVCKQHGSFWQTSDKHTSYRCGCFQCASEYRGKLKIKRAADKFIAVANEVHCGKYDYSLVDYDYARSKVRIICLDHGVFEQTPNQHLNGSGCAKCSENFPLTTKEFISRSKAVHGNKYDYSKVEYINKGTAVTILCPEHGDFEQMPSLHYSRGYGCPSCGKLKAGLSRRNDTAWFIDSAREVHGDKYDYCKSVYSTSTGRICIVCPRHGDFYQRPHTHIVSKHGCPKCAAEILSQALRKTTEDFVAHANEVHGGLYDYSKTLYTSDKGKVQIHCSSHGSFWQGAGSHIQGHGCPECAKFKVGFQNRSGLYSTSGPSNLYILKINESFIKVGLAKKVSKRMYYINKQSNYVVEKLYSVSGKANELFELEQKILRKSNLKSFYPEASFAGSTECLELSELPKVLQIIEDWEKNQQPEEEIEEGA